MRELDYKIWDYTLQKLVTKQMAFTYSSGKGSAYFKHHEHLSVIEKLLGAKDINKFKRFKVLLYINKKDAHGNKIYEFDLVRNEGGLKGVIMYDEEKCFYGILWETGNFTPMIDGIIRLGCVLTDRKLMSRFKGHGLRGI